MSVWQLEKPLKIGYIVKNHGYLGHIKVAFLFDFLPKILKKDKYLFIEFDNKPVPFKINHIQWSDDSNAVILLDMIENESDTLTIVHKDVFISALDVPLKFEKSLKEGDLTAFSISIQGQKGTFSITDYYDNGIYPTATINFEEREVDIPLPDDFIVKIDQRKMIIFVQLPDGLLD